MFFNQTRLILGVLLWQIASHIPAHCEEMIAREIRVGNVVTVEDRGGQQAIVLRVAAAYFNWLNAKGGIDGHPIKLISYSDGGDRRSTLDLTRQLVETDKISVLFQMRSSASRALAPYLHFHGIPSFLNFDDDEQGAAVSGYAEGQAIGAFISQKMGQSKIAIVYEESEFGTAALDGFWTGLGSDNAHTLVTNMSGDKAVSGNVVAHVGGSSSDAIVLLGGTKFLERCLKQMAELVWRPVPLMASAAMTIQTSLVPTGAVSLSGRPEDESDEWNSFKEKLFPADLLSGFAVDGYRQARTLVSVLRSSTGESLSSNDSVRSPKRKQREQVMDVVRFDGCHWQLDRDKVSAADQRGQCMGGLPQNPATAANQSGNYAGTEAFDRQP